jgi:hypothetical protein
MSKTTTIKIVVRASESPDEAKVLAEVKDVIGREFANQGVKAEIATDEDLDGGQIVMVKIRHPLVLKPVQVSGFLAKESKIRDEAWKRGIRRFLHIRHLFDSKQEVTG